MWVNKYDGGDMTAPFGGFKQSAIGHGAMPVVIFLVVAVIFHIALRYTKYGKYTYAIGGNMQAARTSGINVKRHLIIVYSIAGLLAGPMALAGLVCCCLPWLGEPA